MTTFANALKETSKTYETSKVSNNEFISIIFGDSANKDIIPIVVSFKESPRTENKSKWYGRPWQPDDCFLPDNHNNYFSLSSFKPDGAGKYYRRKAHFKALHCIMLDDIGTKVPIERLILKPSWLIETSPNNFQAGYILQEPIDDAKIADSFMKSIIDAGLCDPGAGGPTARLARLPVGINNKHEDAFQCQIKEWNPDLEYSIEDIVSNFELDLKGKKKAKVKIINKEAESEDEIYSPAPDENVVITALKSRGLYKSPLGNGKHDITCPWVHEHTDGVDGGSAYFEPDDTYPIGGFKCLHGHCEKRKIHDLLQFLGIETTSARMKPTIRIVAGEIHRIVDRAESELSEADRYYQRGGLIVTVNTDPSTKETLVKEISQPALMSILSSIALWVRYDKRVDSWVRVDPSTKVISVLHDATGYNHLPVLNGIAHQPYLRGDGSLVTNSGYDKLTGMFGVFDENKFNIPQNPSKQDAFNALDKISGLLSEFSFKSDSDKAAALTAILTASIRPSLINAPMFHVKAPQISSGKSFLCQIISTFASPKNGSPTSFPQDDEECRKMLLAELLKSPAVIEFDNLTSDLIAHKSLCTALTSEFMTGRILGISKTATVNTRTLFLSSGNNVGPVQDMVRRCITINLDPACENPASRTFKNPNLLNDLRSSRDEYVSAALTIIRAWIVAGRPLFNCKTLASYSDWSTYCRQPLLWLGMNDPTESLFEAMNDDPERELLGRLLAAWENCFASKATMIRDAVNLTMQSVTSAYVNELSEIMNDISADRNGINRKALGHWLRRHESRVANNMRFVRFGGGGSAVAWRVEKVS